MKSLTPPKSFDFFRGQNRNLKGGVEMNIEVSWNSVWVCQIDFFPSSNIASLTRPINDSDASSSKFL